MAQFAANNRNIVIGGAAVIVVLIVAAWLFGVFDPASVPPAPAQ